MSPSYGFDWPNQAQEPLQHIEQLPQGVGTTVKNIITTLFTKTDISTGTTMDPQESIITERTTAIIPSVVNNTFKDQTTETTTENIFTTVTDSISTTVRNILSTVSTGNGFSLTESSNSSNTLITSNNTTLLSEVVEANSTMEVTGSTIGSTLENITTETSTVTETIKSIISTTENVLNETSVTDSTLNNQTSSYQSHEGMYHDESVTVYVILGVLLAILILILIVLLVFYKKYKKCRQNSGDYCVTQLKEIDSNSSIKTSSDLRSINVKH